MKKLYFCVWQRLVILEVNDWALDVIYFPTLLDHFLSWVTVYSPFISFYFHKYGQKVFRVKRFFFLLQYLFRCYLGKVFFFTLLILSNVIFFINHNYIPAFTFIFQHIFEKVDSSVVLRFLPRFQFQ